MTAIFASAERHPLGIGVSLAGIARWRLERVVAEAARCLVHDRPGQAFRQRRIWIFVLPRSLEYVAAINNLATQVAGLARNTAELFEFVIVRLKLVVRYR